MGSASKYDTLDSLDASKMPRVRAEFAAGAFSDNLLVND
jgi:hypothetical protein